MPPIGPRVHIHLNPVILRAVDDLVERSGLRRAEVIRRLLTGAISDRELIQKHIPLPKDKQ